MSNSPFKNLSEHNEEHRKLSDAGFPTHSKGYLWNNAPTPSVFGEGQAWFSDIKSFGYCDGLSWSLFGGNQYHQKKPDNNGTLCVNIGLSTTVLTSTSGTNVKSTAAPFTTVSNSAIKTTIGTAGTEAYDINFPAFSITPDTDKFIGLWIHRTGSNPVASGGLKPIAVTLYFTSNNFSTFSLVPLLVYPGTHFYVVPLITNSVWNQNVTSISTIRVKTNSGGASGVVYGSDAGFYPAGNDAMYLGDIYKSPIPAKAKFIIGFDDCKRDLLIPGDASTAIVGGDGVNKGHSFTSFAASYGFRVNAYIITGAVLNVNTLALGYLNVRQLCELRDEWGVCFGAHSHTHPQGGDIGGTSGNKGLLLLGPYGYAALGAGPYTFTSTATGITCTATNDSSSIVDDTTTCLDYLYKFGFGSATKYFALPQGSCDYYVNNAIEQFAFTYVRNISNVVPFGRAHNTYQLLPGRELMTPEHGYGASCISLEATLVEADVVDYVDRIIASGAVGSSYVHSFGTGSSASRLNCKWLFDYLKIKSDLGLIDVVTMDNL